MCMRRNLINRGCVRLGITASQCAVLDYLFDCEKEEVTQRDIEKGLNLRNPTVTGLLKRLDEKGYILSVPSNTDKLLQEHLSDGESLRYPETHGESETEAG